MIWRWVVGILIFLLVLLLRTRAGVLIAFGDLVTLDVRIGPFRLHILPQGEKPPQKKKKKAQKTPESTGGTPEAKGKKTFPKPDLADIRDAVRTLAPPLKRALSRTRRGIRVDPLSISLQIGGGEDPAGAASLYGRVSAGIWAAMPALEQILDIPSPHIHTEVDFETEKTRLQGSAGISIRIGTALAVGVGIAIPALRCFFRYIKRKRKQQRSAPEPSGAGAA